MARLRGCRLRFVVALSALAMGVVGSGCRQQEARVEVLSLEGTIEQVSAALDGTGSVAVSYYNDKRKEDAVGTGIVTKETEILINGVVAKLSDLRVGDRVRGEVRVEKDGQDRKQVALKIYVSRAASGNGG